MSATIPPKESSFQVDVVGELTKHRYIGDFKSKIPNHKARALIDKHRAFLNGELAAQLDLETLTLHHRIAHLRYTLIEYPKWWLDADLGYELYDINIITEVYNQVLKMEREWYRQVWGDEALAELEGVDSENTENGEK